MDLFLEQERVIVTSEDVRQVWPDESENVNSILSRMARKGWLQRVKRGTYALISLGEGTTKPATANAWAVASILFEPCFISGWSASEHWGLTDQIFNSISLVTENRVRSKSQELGGIRFRIRTLPAEKMFGSQKVWFGRTIVKVADPHRTLLDVLDSPSFGGGGRHVLDISQNYWSGSLNNSDQLLQYALKYGRGTVFKRLGFLAETFGNPAANWLEQCYEHRSKGLSLLDPESPNQGPINSKWRLRINLPLNLE